MAKWVYTFGDGKAEGDADMRNLLGGKGANLAEMASLGLPVPPGLHDHHRGLHLLLRQRQAAIPPELKAQVETALAAIEQVVGGKTSAIRPTRCWSRCARARAPRCRA